MKHLRKAGFAVSAGSRLVAVEFEIDPPAAVNIHISQVQTPNAPRPWGNYYGWLPDPSARRYIRLRLSCLKEAINSFNLDHLFFNSKNHTN